MSEFSGCIEFYTEPDGSIETRIVLGTSKTALWARVLSTFSTAFDANAPLVLSLMDSVIAGEISLVEDEDMVEEDEDEDASFRSH